MAGRLYFGPTTHPLWNKAQATKTVSIKRAEIRPNCRDRLQFCIVHSIGPRCLRASANNLGILRFSFTDIHIDQLTRKKIYVLRLLETENDRQDANVHALLPLVRELNLW